MHTLNGLPKIRPQSTRQEAVGRISSPIVTATAGDQDNTDQSNKIAYTVAEAINASGLGRTTIFALLKDGSLRKIKIGTRTLIFKSDLVALLEQGATLQ